MGLTVVFVPEGLSTSFLPFSVWSPQCLLVSEMRSAEAVCVLSLEHLEEMMKHSTLFSLSLITFHSLTFGNELDSIKAIFQVKYSQSQSTKSEVCYQMYLSSKKKNACKRGKCTIPTQTALVCACVFVFKLSLIDFLLALCVKPTFAN